MVSITWRTWSTLIIICGGSGGMGLDEEPGLFLVRVAQIFASLDGFGKARVEVFGLRDARAVRAASAEIGQAVGPSGASCERLLQAVHGAGEHKSQRVFARSVRSGKNDGVRKALARQHLAQAMDGFRVAGEIRKGHSREFCNLVIG